MTSGLRFEEPLWLVLLPTVLWLLFRAERNRVIRLSQYRRAAVRWLRLASMCCVILAMAGLQAYRRDDRMTLVFAVDASRSVGTEGRDRALALLRSMPDELPAGARAAVVVFGKDAMVESMPRQNWRATQDILSRPDADATDLGASVRLASSLIPLSHEGRVVLVTDGIETRGSVEAAVAETGPGIDIIWAPLDVPPQHEVAVESVHAPETLKEAEPHIVRVAIRASTDTSGVLRLYCNGQGVEAGQVSLRRGESNVFSIERVAPKGAGPLVYRAEIEAPRDGFSANNRATAACIVEGTPRVLVVDRQPGSAAGFAAALEASGIDVETVGPGGLPADLAALAMFEAIVLSDVPATSFTDSQLDLLRLWVESVGGGLLMVGGPESFGPGGWWKTPVETVLPVEMDVKNRRYFPSLGLMLLIDKSGSMAGMEKVSKIEVAKSAAVEVVELLSGQDRIGVVAFDEAAKWIVPMTSGDRKTQINRMIGTLRAGGGTDAYPAMGEAHKALASTDAQIKHVILLTDGQLLPADHQGLARRMEGEGITVSTIAIGSDADIYTLRRIALNGGGRFYSATDLTVLPRIFLREVFHVARSWVVEEPFRPVVRSGHSALVGFDLNAFPALTGYVAASEKPSAQHPLGTHQGDPLLSLWRCGLGKGVAFTSDVKGRWSAEWMSSDLFAPFWARIVRWCLRDEATRRIQVVATSRENQLDIATDLLDDDGAFVNGAEMAALVAGPDGGKREVQLNQTGPGRYEGSIEAESTGAHIVAVVQKSEGRAVAGAMTAVSVPYADELRAGGASPDAMERLVESGRVRMMGQSENLLGRRGTGGRIQWPMAPALLIAAAVLIVAEVAARRLQLPELRRFARSSTEPVTQRVSHIEELKAAKGRAIRVKEPAPSPAEPPVMATVVVEQTAEDQASAVARDVPVQGEPAAEATYTSRLLHAKRRAGGLVTTVREQPDRGRERG